MLVTIAVTFLLIIFGLLIPTVFSIYTFYCILGDFKGAPYVPTTQKVAKEILDQASLKKGQTFIELGSGDSRVTRLAVQQFGVNGIGYDINLPLVYYARLLSRMRHLKNISFQRANFFSVDLTQADVIFCFLLPKTLQRLADKFNQECPPGTQIISHGFKIAGMESKLTHTTPAANSFPPIIMRYNKHPYD